MTDLEKVDRDIATMEESQKLALQRLGMPISAEERAKEQASLEIYVQDLRELRDLKKHLLKEAADAKAAAEGSK